MPASGRARHIHCPYLNGTAFRLNAMSTYLGPTTYGAQWEACHILFREKPKVFQLGCPSLYSLLLSDRHLQLRLQLSLYTNDSNKFVPILIALENSRCKSSSFLLTSLHVLRDTKRRTSKLNLVFSCLPLLSLFSSPQFWGSLRIQQFNHPLQPENVGLSCVLPIRSCSSTN